MATERIDAIQLDITSKTTGDNVDKLIDSLTRLGSALDKLKSKSITVDVTNTGTAVNKLNSSFATTAIKLTAIIALCKKLGSVISSSVANSATYIKTLNMFTLSMGEYADSAAKYAQTVSDALGIDPAEWLKTQGTFQTLAKGFGVTGDKAAYLSQQLTQLAYDYSSYWGITVEEAANKIRAASSGRVEPIRKLGVSPTQAELTDYAKNPKNYGKQTFAINQQTGAIEANTIATGRNTEAKLGNYNQINSGDKFILRTNYLIEQSSHLLGDYSRALNDPYNQLNIFKQQLNQTSRAFGNMFIPMLNKVLPYLSAFAQLATQAFQSLAQLFGFELPDMKERTGINTKDYDSVVKSTGKAKDNAKKMKDYMLGIDELNVFNPNTGAGAGGGAGKKGKNTDLSGLLLKGYDFLGKGIENSIKKAKENLEKLFADWKKNPFELPIKIAGTIGAGFWEWVLGKSPEQLAKDAAAHGKTIGQEFADQFKEGVKTTLGGVGTNFWSWFLGKTPEEMAAEAQQNGHSIESAFVLALVDKIPGLSFSWIESVPFMDAIFGSPDKFAKRAAEAGRTIGEQFVLEFGKKCAATVAKSKLLTFMYEKLTGHSLKADMEAMNNAYIKGNKKEETTKTTNPYAYVSADTAKRISSIQNGTKNKIETETLTIRPPEISKAAVIEDATKSGKLLRTTYIGEINKDPTSVNTAAQNGLFKPAVNGASGNGTGESKFKYVSFQEAKAYYSNFNSKETEQKVTDATASMANAGASAAESKEIIKAFKTAGENAAKGYSDGITKNLVKVGYAGASLGAVALEAANKITKTASPSKAFAEIGMFSALGYAKGIADNTKSVTDSVSEMAGKAITTMRKASAMSNSIITGVSVPTTNNAGYSVGASNEGAMASLAGNIYQAVVSGIAGANIGSDGKGDIKVIIDGKEVFKAVQTESRKRGVAVSNGAFSR